MRGDLEKPVSPGALSPGLGGEAPPQPAAPSRGMMFMIHLLGTAGSIGAFIFGVFVALSLSLKCIIAGILLILLSILLASLEAPYFLPFLKQGASAFFDEKPKWIKGAVYIGFGVFLLCLCIQTGTIIGAAIFIGIGVLYGLISFRG